MNVSLRNLSHSDVVNTHTLNIFTDASIQIVKEGSTKKYNGAISAVIEYNGIELHQASHYIPDTTNNYSELAAIKLGLTLALAYRNYSDKITTINLFSDSKISIFGLREWIFKWRYSNVDCMFYGSANEPIKNQSIIKEIVSIIVNSNLHINFWHVRGHHNAENIAQLNDFQTSFIRENHLNVTNVDTELLTYFIKLNNQVDIVSRSIFNNIPTCPFNINPSNDFTITMLPEYKALIKS